MTVLCCVVRVTDWDEDDKEPEVVQSPQQPASQPQASVAPSQATDPFMTVRILKEQYETVFKANRFVFYSGPFQFRNVQGPHKVGLMCTCYFGHYSLKYSVDESATLPKIIYIGGASTDRDPSEEGQSVSARGRSRGDMQYVEPLVKDSRVRKEVTGANKR